ncbi:MAG: hypothetical protein IJT83_04960, partial [Victivallales bacterium]|nr:hypothetical protein [Victivallales bacterium]
LCLALDAWRPAGQCSSRRLLLWLDIPLCHKHTCIGIVCFGNLCNPGIKKKAITGMYFCIYALYCYLVLGNNTLL